MEKARTIEISLRKAAAIIVGAGLTAVGGGGGGIGTDSGTPGRAGGSWIVVVRYPYTPSPGGGAFLFNFV